MLLLDVPMPKYCYECPCRNEKTGKCNVTFRHIDFKKPSDCPLKEQEEGIWLRYADNSYKCSKCGHRIMTIEYRDLNVLHKYCDICGTKMTKIEEDDGNYRPSSY